MTFLELFLSSDTHPLCNLQSASAVIYVHPHIYTYRPILYRPTYTYTYIYIYIFYRYTYELPHTTHIIFILFLFNCFCSIRSRRFSFDFACLCYWRMAVVVCWSLFSLEIAMFSPIPFTLYRPQHCLNNSARSLSS